MVGDSFGQGQFGVRMEWGFTGPEKVSSGADYTVIIDVLSFTTTLSVALDCGVQVFPYPLHDATAHEFARRNDALLAVGRSAAAQYSSGRQMISLSPASVRTAAGLRRIVLPSPNGSALASHLASSGSTVLGACLRNRTAVAQWLATQCSTTQCLTAQGQATQRQATERLANQRDHGTPSPVIAVVAAGERWPDGTLRPAAEDLWGAGAVISALDSLGMTGMSPEARSAAGAWHGVEATLGAALASCSSGLELASAGYTRDVDIAAELDASGCVPLLSGGRFEDAAGDRIRDI